MKCFCAVMIPTWPPPIMYKCCYHSMEIYILVPYSYLDKFVNVTNSCLQYKYLLRAAENARNNLFQEEDIKFWSHDARTGRHGADICTRVSRRNHPSVTTCAMLKLLYFHIHDLLKQNKILLEYNWNVLVYMKIFICLKCMLSLEYNTLKMQNIKLNMHIIK